MIRVGKNGIAGLLLILGGIASALSKWYLVWLAQDLGGTGALGIYGTILAFATPLFVVAQLGLRTIFLTMKNSYPWKTYVSLRGSGLLIASLLLLGFFLLSERIPLVFGLAIISLKIMDSILDLDVARIQSTGSLITVAILSLIGAPLSVLFATGGALSTGSFEVAIFGAAIASALMALIASFLAKKSKYQATTSESGLQQILSASGPVAGAQLLAALVLYLPVLMLTFTSDLQTVGIYTGIAYVLTAADLVGSSISKVMITPLRGIRESSGISEVIKVSQRLTIMFFFLGCIGATIFIIGGASILEWIYGPAFRPSALILALFAFASIFIVLSFIQSASLNILNKYYGVAGAYLIACIASVVTGLILLFFSVDGLEVGVSMALAGAFARFLGLAIIVSKSNIALPNQKLHPQAQIR